MIVAFIFVLALAIGVPIALVLGLTAVAHMCTLGPPKAVFLRQQLQPAGNSPVPAGR